MKTAIADTGFWLALMNAGDSHHAVARAVHDAGDFRYATTWPVLTETCHLLAHRVHPEGGAELLEAVTDSRVLVAELDANDLVRAASLMRRYADLPMDLADASLVILAERLGHGRILSTDRRDFRTYRWKARRPFSNLLFPND